jgi:hypothetical protein
VARTVYQQVEREVKAGTQLAIRRMCTLTGVSWAGFYRRGGGSRSASVELRDQVQRVALEWPTYCSRRITAELRRCGLPVNRKRVQRLMREDNLRCLRKRKFVATTESTHGLKIYPNLGGGAGCERRQLLWRADITYIRLLEEFVYLAVVLDTFSRRAIGWAGGNAGSPVGRGGTGDGIGTAAASARIGAPLRSGDAVCQPRLEYPFGYSDDMLIHGGSCQRMLAYRHFSASIESVDVPMGIAAESKMAAKQLAGVGLPYRNNRPCLTFGHFHNPNSRKEAKCLGNSLLLYSCRHWRD